MNVRQLKPGIFSVGAIDWERRFFDEIIPIPDGTTYNSYLIKASEKTVLIDTVEPTKEHELIANLKALEVTHIDYIVANHAEQDHSGSLPKILELYPGSMILTNPKCREMLKEHLLIPDDKFIDIKDGETISLGDKTLGFIYAPWVHWPETMFTYIKEDKLLFSCDFLGAHLASTELYADTRNEVYESSKRYYAEIMMPFRNHIQKHLEKIKDMDITTIAPSHGPVYNKPEFMINAYKDWTSDTVKNEVLLPYVSMHGSTRAMADFLLSALVKRNIPVKLFNLSQTDVGHLAMSLVDAATMVVATPTFLGGAHPSAAYAVMLANSLRPKLRFVSLIGSYGWGGRTKEQIASMLGNLKVEFIDPVIAKGYPKAGDFEALDNLAEKILQKHKSINITDDATLTRAV